MSEKIKRHRLSTAIRDLLNVNGASHVTITLAAADARAFAKDLDWARKTSVREYEAEVEGSIKPFA